MSKNSSVAAIVALGAGILTRSGAMCAVPVLVAVLGLAAIAAAQSDRRNDIRLKDPVVEPTNSEDPTGDSSVSGRIEDENGTSLPGVLVTLLNAAGNASMSTATDDTGRFCFKDIPAGDWTIESAAPAFKTVRSAVTTGGRSVFRTITLEPQRTLITTPAASRVGYGSELMKAVANGDARAVRELLASGADVNGVDADSNEITPLFIAIEDGRTEIAEILLEFGAKVNARDENGRTPLMHIDSDAEEALVELLIKYGAEADLRDRDGNNALIIVMGNDVGESIVQRLVRETDDVNLQNSAGRTALMEAAFRDNLEAVRILLHAGADVNLKDGDGESAWDLTSDTGVVELLEEFGASAGQ